MSFNSMKNLGADMTLGDVIAKNITCQTITIENSDNESLTAETINQDPVRNTIQSYDSYRDTEHTLWLNPLGGNVIAGDTLTATTGNFDVINVATLNVSNPDDPTIL